MNVAVGRPVCGVVYKGKPPCRQKAGWGTSHIGVGPCKNHGGTLPVVAAKMDRVIIENNAREQLAKFGEASVTDPESALLDLVSQSAALVMFYGEQVSVLASKDSLLDLDGKPFGPFGNTSRVGAGMAQARHLFGPEIDLDKDGSEHVIGEQLRGIVVLWNEERDRLAKYAKAALAAGIEKRRVQMAEEHGEQIVLVVNNVLVQMGISGDQLAAARTMIATEFRRIGRAGEPA